MGNVNELHEQESAPSDGADSSSSEGSSSSNSIAMSEQQTFELPVGVHFKAVESTMIFDLGDRTTCSKHSDACIDLVDSGALGVSIEHSTENTSDDSFPLSESALPTSFDLSEEISPIPSDHSDVFHTPDVSQDELGMKEISTQNPPLPLTELKGEFNEDLRLHNRILVSGQQNVYVEDSSSKMTSTDTKPQVYSGKSEVSETDYLTTGRSCNINEDMYDLSTLEDSLMPDASTSVFLDESVQTSFDLSKSESGMTSLAEHFNAISLEEPSTSATENKAFAHSLEEESLSILSDVSSEDGSPVVEDAALLRPLSEIPPDKMPAEFQHVGEEPRPVDDEPEQRPSRTPEKQICASRTPSPQFELHKKTLEDPHNQPIEMEKKHNNFSADVLPPSFTEIMEGNDPLYLAQDAISSSRESICEKEKEKEGALPSETPSTGGVDEVPLPKHTADRPNWALAPVSPPKAQIGPAVKSVKRHKSGPRRARQGDNDNAQQSPDLIQPSSTQKVHKILEASRAPRRVHEPVADVKPKEINSFAFGDSSTNQHFSKEPSAILSTPCLKELSTHGQVDHPLHPSAESSSRHLPVATVARVPTPDITSSTKVICQSSSKLRPVSQEAIKDERLTSNLIGTKTPHIFYEASAEPMVSVGSSTGLQSKNPGIEIKADFVSHRHGLVTNGSSLASVLSEASGQMLPTGIPSWPSLEEELWFHSTNRPLRSRVHETRNQVSQNNSELHPLVHPKILAEDPAKDPGHFDGSGGLVAVTKTRHVVFEESSQVGEATHTVTVNLPSKRSKSLEPGENTQYGTSRTPRLPFQSGIPIPTNGQFHREPMKNQEREPIVLPRAPRLSAPHDRVTHTIQRANSQHALRGGALAQRNRAMSQPFMAQQPIAPSGHSRSPMPMISVNRNPSLLSEARHKPNIPVGGRHPAGPRANVGAPIYLYPAAVVSVQEANCQHNPLCYDSLPQNFTNVERGGFERTGYSGGAGDLTRYHPHGPVSFSGSFQNGFEARDRQ